MSTVLLAVFNDYDAADRVREMLVRDGFPTDRVELTASRNLGRASLQPADSLHGKCVQFFRVLLGREEERDYPEMLAERIDNGAATVTVLPRGAIETARATHILKEAHPADVVGHDLAKHGWEHAAARRENAWAEYVWLETGPDTPHCIYCRMFPGSLHDDSHDAPAVGTASVAEVAAAGLNLGGTLSRVVDADASAVTKPGDAMTAAILPRARPFQHFGIRRVPLAQSLEWLRRGWDDLRQIRSSSLVHGALIAALGGVLLILGSSHPYFVAAAVSGYLLVGPIMTTGVCELSRRRASGEPLGFDESLQALTRNSQELLKFGAILAAVAAVWFVASEVMLRSVLHSSGSAAAEALWGGFTDATSRAQIIVYVGSGAVLAGLVFTVSVVAVPLIIDRHASAAEAMWTSMKAALWNLPAMLVWSALIVALTAFGFLTMLLGMVFVAPLLGHATWHAYRDLIE